MTIRLVDSLPREVARLLLNELEPLPPGEHKQERRKRIEQCLDRGYGCCALRVAELALVTQNALQHFDGDRYELHAWAIMPNHVHALIRTMRSGRVGGIVGSWKSFTGRHIVRWAKEHDIRDLAHGAWYREYYDRFIRNERHYAAAVHYIHQNPVVAGLAAKPEDWPWSSAGTDFHPPSRDTEA